MIYHKKTKIIQLQNLATHEKKPSSLDVSYLMHCNMALMQMTFFKYSKLFLKQLPEQK